MVKGIPRKEGWVPRPKQTRHFLLTPAAKTRRRDDIARMSDDGVYAEFLAARFSENDGIPFCPRCRSEVIRHYTVQVRSRAKRDAGTPAVTRPKRLMSCKACTHQFTARSGTKLAYSKRNLRDELSAMMLFVNQVGGEAALALSRDQCTDYRTSLVFTHKMREAMAGQLSTKLMDGIVHIDGAYFGGKPRRGNNGGMKSRAFIDEKAKQVIISVRSSTHTRVFERASEGDARPEILSATDEHNSIIYADGESGWNHLRGRRKMERVNHNKEFSRDGVNVNWCESYFGRLRLAGLGIHHGFAGPNLINYAEEMAWREDHRRKSNGAQCTLLLTGLLTQPMSRTWRGYWQRMRGRPPKWWLAVAA